LQAPPGAGKTTRVPLALLEARAFEGKLLMLEPRRLATRAAAERMADMLGEPVGETVGYRMRGESKSGPNTRIEVVTEGILTRMIQSDPELPGVACVVFDEFHERSLNGDLGLALAWEVREALRPDLQVLVMSATLDAGPVAELLSAPVVTSDGRAFDVETRWLERPLRKEARFEASVADLVTRAMAETEGGVLVFLPGEGEIRRVAGALSLGPDVALHMLYGALPFAQQRAAIRPEVGKRKVVLATSIAETSLTIEDISVVVDAGRARRARFDPGSGMSRLVTEKVSRAEADQRRGRAGRVRAGVCYRMWSRAEEGALPAFPPAEIEAMKALERPPAHAHRGTIERVRSETKRLKRFCGASSRSLGEMAALAYPDRIGLRRPGTDPRYILSGGKGAVMDSADGLAGQRLIVALDLDGDAREAKLRLACALSQAELRGLYGDQIAWVERCAWSKRDRKVLARRQEMFGALVLDDRIWKDAPTDAVTEAMLDGVRQLGLEALSWDRPARLLRARVGFVEGGPDWSDAALLDSLETWLAPYLSGVKTAEGLKGVNVAEALRAALSWDDIQALDAQAPAKFTTPLGRGLALDYSGEVPELEVRLQEMFGVTKHPVFGPERVPLKITLLSPASKPVQVTTDLPGFWAGSYADVRKDMKARYPRHPWPEDPTVADPTLRAKPRGT